MEKKRIIHDFNFRKPFLSSGQKTHLSLVDEGANMQDVLVMKSTTISNSTQSVESYDDNGNRSHSKQSVEIRDYGEDYVYITERKVFVVDYSVKK